jgi:hypothetical protein
VVRPPIAPNVYFQDGSYDSARDHPVWPEKLLARLTYWRARGRKGGMFFVDRRQVYSDQIGHRLARGLTDEPVAKL